MRQVARNAILRGVVDEGALRLSSADFDAFLEPVQTTRGAPARGGAAQRRALRERIEVWARGVSPRLAQLGISAEVVVPDEVEQHLSSRAPRSIAQRVVFVRDAFARSSVPRTEPEHDPLRSHAYLALTIDSVHVEVSLEVCPEAEADVKNLRARIADPTRLLELTTLLETLPEEFAFGVIGVPHFPRVKEATADEVRALLDDSQRNRRPLWIGWSVKREVALAHSTELEEQLADAIVALAHAYKLLAWAPDNDLVGGGRKAGFRAGRVTWAARALADKRIDDERRERREERRKRRRSRKGAVRIEGTRREREDARRIVPHKVREAPPQSKRSPSEESDAPQKSPLAMRASAPPARRPILPTTLRARGARIQHATPEVDRSGTIEKGTRVRVLAGPFADKIGIVQELDGKGRARVRLGLLGATLDLKDLVASGEGSRPMLASSHRRPRKRTR
jgi:hypothetical protein